MTAPRAAGHDNATVRGAVVLIVAIVIGLALLARSGDSGDDSAAATTTRATSESTEAGVTSSTLAPIVTDPTASVPVAPDDTRPPGEVTVVVLNGTTANVGGAAGESSTTIGAGGYIMLDPSDAIADLDTTVIYALPEFQADAEAIRGLLSLPDATIEVKPEESLGERSEDADIVVAIGDDIAPA